MHMIAEKNSEDTAVTEAPFDLRSSMISNYLSIPSKPRHTIFAHEREATCLAFDSRGTYLATGGGDTIVKVWDIENGKQIQTYKNHNMPISTLAFSHDNEFLCACANNKVKLWKMATERLSLTF